MVTPSGFTNENCLHRQVVQKLLVTLLSLPRTRSLSLC